MTLSTTALNTWLQQFGVWGYFAIAAIPLAIYFLKKYTSSTAATPVPSPVPNAATNPASLAGLSPLLNDALAALGVVPSSGATVADVPHTTALQLANDSTALVNAKITAGKAALADLAPSVATATKTAAMLIPLLFLFGGIGCHRHHDEERRADVSDAIGAIGDAGTPETRGQKLFIDHVKSRLKHRLTSEAITTKSGEKKVLTAEEAAKHISLNLADEKIFNQAKKVGAAPDGPILGLFDKLLTWISDHQEQIEALIEWAFSLLKLIPFI